MKNCFYVLSISVFVFVANASIVASAQEEVSLTDIKKLPGYRSYSTLSSFTEHLRQNPSMYKALKVNEGLAARILGSTMAQRQVLSKIESSGDVQQALSGFSDGTEANSFSSPRTQAESPEFDENRTSQYGSGSNGNLAAQRAVEKAQREREAANRRANAIMAQAREIMDREQSPEELARQQKEIIASNKAVAAVLVELSDQPEALQAFLSDGALVQSVMDKAVTLSEALEQVGADLNKDTASAGDAAVAENNTPVVASEPETSKPEVTPEQPDRASTQSEEPTTSSITQPEPAPVPENNNQQSLDDQLNTLAQINPQAHTLLRQDSALQDSVLSGDITFDELLAELTTRLEQDDSQQSSPEDDPDDEIFHDDSEDEPLPSKHEKASAEIAVDTSGNCDTNHDPCDTGVEYDGTKIFNINQMPQVGRDVLDENGWPKYLNVPKGCPAPENDMQYVHEFRYGHTDTAMMRIMPLHLIKRRGNWSHIGLTRNERMAVPFYTGKPVDDYGGAAGLVSRLDAGSDSRALKYGHMRVTVSHCPGDFSDNGVTLEGEEPLKRQPVPHWPNRCVPDSASKLHLTILGKGQDNPQPLHTCVLRPFKRYFINVKLRDVSANEKMVEIAKNVREKLPAVEIEDGMSRSQILSMLTRLHFRGKAPHPIGGGSSPDIDTFVNGEPRLANNTVLFQGAVSPLPYNGACVEKNYVFGEDSLPAYPLNYSTQSCGPRLTDKNYTQKNQICYGAHCLPDDTQIPNPNFSKLSCYDVLGKLPSLMMDFAHIGNDRVWQSGYNKPVYSSYVCEQPSGERICAAHREGELRSKVCDVSRDSIVRPSTLAVQQCQFDREHGLFKWVAVNTEHQFKRPQGHFCTFRETQVAKTSPGKCHLGEQKFQVGERARLNCVRGAGTSQETAYQRVAECQQRADSPALPVMVDAETGYDISRMRDEQGDLIGINVRRNSCEITSL